MEAIEPIKKSNPEQTPMGFGFSAQTNEKPCNADFQIVAILPAYNEGGRIGGLLAVLRDVALIDEIIVVDDGSQDATAQEAIQAGSLDGRIRVVRHPRNQGKGAAMFTGSRLTQAAIVLFLDSDLINLSPSQVEDLIQPVASGQSDMSIGLFARGDPLTEFSQRLTPWLSGQRCIRRHLLNQVSWPAAAGYGVETAITIAAQQGEWKVTRVPLHGVSHPPGEFHRGFWRGVANRLRMYGNILQAVWIAGSPNYQFARLTPRIRLASFLMTFLIAATLAFNQAQALAPIGYEDLAAINLEGVFRVQVVDETTTEISDLLTIETDRQKLLDLPEIDLSPLNLPAVDLPILTATMDRPQLIQSVDLSLEKARRDGFNDQLRLQLTGDPDPEATYTLVLVTSTGVAQKYPLNPKDLGRRVKPGVATIDLGDYEDPALVGIALEARLGDEIQRSGWTLILFPEKMPKIQKD